MGEKNTYRVYVGKPEGNTSLGRPICRWKHNIKMNGTEIGWGDVDWIDLSQDRD
jgi:hypothetical protein